MHTVFLLVGPTECGKTAFAENVLIPQLQDHHATWNIQYIGSDAIRRDLLAAPTMAKGDRRMLEASAAAFGLLEARLDAALQFPVSAHFIIVDTQGLSEEFRAMVKDRAHAHQYQVEAIVFDYKDSREYYAVEDANKALITRNIKRLRETVLPHLKRQVDTVHRIRSRDFLGAPPRIIVENCAEWWRTELDPNQAYWVIGDVHEDLGALKSLLAQRGYTFEGDRMIPPAPAPHPILIGDVIDKGHQTQAMIEFLYTNQDQFLMVLGNHENFVAQVLRGHTDPTKIPPDVLATYFTSLPVLQADPILQAKFLALVDQMVPFFHFAGSTAPSFYVTHAPCSNKYLGKLDPTSQRKQRNWRPDRETPLQEQLAWLEKEAVGNYPYHIFGHIATNGGIRLKNQVGIDGGVDRGHTLFGVGFRGDKLQWFRAKATGPITEALSTVFQHQPHPSVHLPDLSRTDHMRLQWILKNHVNFLAPTMSPVDKDEAEEILESLNQGLQYYRDHGVDQVCLQPKYMGSRCTVYLTADPETTYAVSRNGYVIRRADLTELFASLRGRYGLWMQDQGWSMLILDGELLPWAVLGDRLITQQFQVIDQAVSAELAALAGNGWTEAADALQTAYAESPFSVDHATTSKAQLIATYGESVYRRFKEVKAAFASYVPISMRQRLAEEFHTELQYFGQEGPPEFRAFTWLKAIQADGTEVFPEGTTSERFRQVSSDPCKVIDLHDSFAVAAASTFFLEMIEDVAREGIVLKPETPKSGVVGAMKARDPRYLRLVYGYDYTLDAKYSHLLKTKRIRNKLATALNEEILGDRMLKTPWAEITPENTGYQQLAADMIFEVAKESSLDPRL